MNPKASRIFFGVLLILIGILFFFQQLFHIEIGGLIFAVIFLLSGGAFFYVVARSSENWWAIIPGFTLVGIGGLIAMGEFAPRFTERYGGAFFLAMIGVSFLVIFFTHREFWWAILPAGVLFTLALTTIVAQYDGLLSGATFFLGLAATFAVLGLMPVGRAEKWPWIPAGICAVISFFIASGSGIFANSVFAFLWPAILVVVGVYLIVRSSRLH